MKVMKRLLELAACFGMFACAHGAKKFDLALPKHPVAVGASVSVPLVSFRKKDTLGPGITRPVPVERVACTLSPEGVFEVSACGSEAVELKALRPGTATLAVVGEVEGSRSRVTGAVSAAPAVKSAIMEEPTGIDDPLLRYLRSRFQDATGGLLEGDDRLVVVEGGAEIEPEVRGGQFLKASGPGKVRVRSVVTGSEQTIVFGPSGG